MVCGRLLPGREPARVPARSRLDSVRWPRLEHAGHGKAHRRPRAAPPQVAAVRLKHWLTQRTRAPIVALSKQLLPGHPPQGRRFLQRRGRRVRGGPHSAGKDVADGAAARDKLFPRNPVLVPARRCPLSPCVPSLVDDNRTRKPQELTWAGRASHCEPIAGSFNNFSSPRSRLRVVAAPPTTHSRSLSPRLPAIAPQECSSPRSHKLPSSSRPRTRRPSTCFPPLLRHRTNPRR